MSSIVKRDRYDFRGTGFRYCPGSDILDYYVFSANVVDIIVCGLNSQHFSDSYIDSGADAYVCSEDVVDIFGNDVIRVVDIK